jgi:hypothetical protein
VPDLRLWIFSPGAWGENRRSAPINSLPAGCNAIVLGANGAVGPDKRLRDLDAARLSRAFLFNDAGVPTVPAPVPGLLPSAPSPASFP